MRVQVTSVLVLAAMFFSANAVADGESVFKQQCASCHGVKGQGMQYVAPALKGSKFIASASVDEIKTMIRAGRSAEQKLHPDFPAAMPPFPQLSDEDIAAVAEYVKGKLQE